MSTTQQKDIRENNNLKTYQLSKSIEGMLYGITARWFITKMWTEDDLLN